METIKFKTNINCEACLSKVTPVLDQIGEIEEWQVDLKDPERTLEVTATDLDTDELIRALKKVGYKAEQV